jgi:cobalt-zinc-cadmium resistance protein CzcA
LYLQNNRIKLAQLDSLYTNFINVAQLRYKSGDTKKVDISTATAKKGEINLLLKQNEVYLANAYTNLKSLINTNDFFVITESAPYQPLKFENLIDSNSVQNHPNIQALYQEANIAEQSKKVERAQGLPDFKLGYVNQSLIGLQEVNGADKYFNSGNRFSSVNIGLAIPLTFGATKARIQALNFKKQWAEVNAQQQKRTLAVQVQNTVIQYQQDIKQYNYFLKEALPNAKEIIDAAQLAYKTGDISYVEYLFALQTATDIQLNYLKSIQQVNQTVIQINSLINR